MTMTLDRALTWYNEGDGAYRLEIVGSSRRSDGAHRRILIGHLIRGMRGSAHFFSAAGREKRYGSVPEFMEAMSRIEASSVLP